MALDRALLRMSQSTRSTRLPDCAKLRARLDEVKVLPELGIAEVTRIHLTGAPLLGAKKEMLERITVKASETIVRRWRPTINVREA